MKTLIISILTLAPILQAWGQNITGTIKDETSEPVSYATVVLLKTDSTLITGVTTGGTGDFSIEGQLYGDYILAISFVGYEKVSCPVNVPDKCHLGDVQLRQNAVELGEIVVKPDMIRRKADGYFFSPVGSPIVTGRNSLDLLNFAPGVWISHSGALSVNGKGGTVVMVNDRLLNLSGEDLRAYLENINAEQIQSIEVVPEPGAQYDAASRGGIIKITLKRQRTGGLVGSVSMNMSSKEDQYLSFLRPGVNLDYRKNKLSLYANVSYTQVKGREESTEKTRYLTGSMREIDNHTRFTNKSISYSGRFGSVYEINDKHSVGADFDFQNSETDSENIGEGITRVGGNIYDIASLSTFHNESERYCISGNYKFKADEMGSGLIIVGDYMTNSTTSKDKNHSTETPTAGVVLENGLNTDMDYNSDLYTIRTDYKHVFTDKFQLDAGAKYAYTDIITKLDNMSFENGMWEPDEELNDHYVYKEGVLAGYVNGTANIGRFNVVAGLRVENTELRPKSYTRPEEVVTHNYTDLFPTIRGMYAFNSEKGHMVNIGYARRISRPNFHQLMPFRIQQDNYTYVIGNPDMKPSYIDSYNVTGILFNKYSLTLGIEDAKDAVNQMVVTDPDNPDILFYQHANIDRVTTFYSALNIPLQFTKWWQAWIDATYMYNKNKLEEFNNNGGTLQARLNNSITYGKGWSSDITYEYFSGGVQGNTTIKWFDTFNFNLKKNLFNNKLTFLLYINNITDRSLRVNIKDPGLFVKNLRSYQSGMARTYGLSLRWNFKAGKEVKVQKAVRGNEEERTRQ